MQRAIASFPTRNGYDVLLLALVGLIAAAQMWSAPDHFRTDSWLALAAGREVWNGGIPHHDLLTAMSHGDRWIDQQWLGQLLTFGLDRIGGPGVLAAVAVALTAGSFGALTIAARRLGAHGRALLLLMPLTAYPFFAQSWQLRTQSFAYPLFAAVVLLLIQDSRRPSRRVYLVLPLLLVWGNVHGSAILGAALISLRGILSAWEARGSVEARRWVRPVVLTLVAPALLLVTPYGVDIASYYRGTLLNPAFTELATEWQPVTSDPALAVPLFLLAALALWTFLRHAGASTLWERAALILLLVAGAMAVRNVVWVALAAVPIVGVSLARSVPSGPATTAPARLNRGIALATIVAMIAATIATLSRSAGSVDEHYPTHLLGALARAAAAAPSAVVVTDLQYADWLLWREPELRGRVAFDARLELLAARHIHGDAALLSGAIAPGRGTHSDIRLFVLDRKSPDTPHALIAGLIARLVRQPGHRVLYDDGRHLIIRARPVRT